MKVELTPKQTEAIEALASEQYNLILYGGAIRGGKTFWGLCSLLIMCQIFPKSRWCVIREDMEKIRTTTIPSFRKIGSSGVLKQSPYEYRHPNGSVILFKSENYAQDKDLDWMRGLEVNGFLFEEINECQEQTLNKAFERAGSWIIEGLDKQPKPVILATCNPTFGWVKTLIYDRWATETLPQNWLYVPAKITDNPHLSDDYKKSLENLPKFEYLVYVEGNWDVRLKTGGEFYKSFEINKHVAATKYNPKLPLHISWDDNVNPYLPTGIFQIEGKNLYQIDEIAGKTPLNTVRAVCNEIIKKYQGHQAGMYIYGDATADKEDTKMEKGIKFYTLILDYLKEFKPQNRVSKSNPSVVMRGNFINTIFEKNFNGIKIIIGENCTNTISDLIGVKEAADGTKNKEMVTEKKIRFQKLGHFSDLFDYIVCQAFINDYQKYITGNRPTNIVTAKSTSKSGY